MIRYLIKQMLTEFDNETVDLGRVLAAITILVFLFLSVWGVVVHKLPFDAQAFGIGAGSVFAGLGGYIAMKREPKKGGSNA